jgi:nucleotide-binding universal stress UspA family protein
MKILFATDGSKYSDWVAEFLNRINWSSNDTMTVLHAIFWMPFGCNQAVYLDTLKEIKSEIGPRILDSALAILKPVRAVKSVALEDGAPEQCIIDVAGKLDIDLIVLGARGLKAIESLFVGSVTKSIAVNSPKPVLIVKHPAYAKHGAIKILLATDGSEHSHAAEDILNAIPFADTTELTILNVTWSTLSDIPETFMTGKDEFRKIAEDKQSCDIAQSERIIHETAGRMRKRFSNIRELSRVGDPSSEILKTAEETEADIIAVGCRGLRGIKRVLGSVSRNVLTHSKCSILIGKMCEHSML